MSGSTGAPLPPADIARRSLPIHTISVDASLHRFFTRKYNPVHFDRSPDGRFNAPASDYGVLYLAEHRAGAFAETFLRRPGRQILTSGQIDVKGYASFRALRPLRLAAIFGRNMAPIGATAEVAHGGPPYDVPQTWSGALHNHPDYVDGISYHSRHDDSELCIGLFERAADAIELADRRDELDAAWFWEIGRKYKIGLGP